VSQIKILEKNIADIDNDNVTITVTDTVATSNGQDIVDFMRNRNNSSAWMTTDSTDAANTQLDFDLADSETFSKIIIIGHNLKSFTIQYWSGGWTDFSTAINETTNSDSTTEFTFDSVTSNQIRVIITGAQSVDADKYIKQFIITNEVRQFDAYPVIKSPVHERNRKISKMLSGKRNFVSQVGGFSVKLQLEYWKNDLDMIAVEKMYTSRLPYLIWLCGGNETQFANKRIGYKLEDIYLMRPSNDYVPAWFSGIYTTGIDIEIELVEVVD
jgi:hypothetical protein